MRQHTELERKLYNWLEVVTDGMAFDGIVFGNQNGVKLEGQLLICFILSLENDQAIEKRYEKVDPTNPSDPRMYEHVIYRSEVTIRLTTLAQSDTIFLAQRIKERIERSDSLDEMDRQNLGLHSMGSTSNNNVIINDKYYGQSDTELTIHYARVTSDIIQSIGTAVIDYTTNTDLSGNINIDDS